jgi:hypothetical protein
MYTLDNGDKLPNPGSVNDTDSAEKPLAIFSGPSRG